MSDEGDRKSADWFARRLPPADVLDDLLRGDPVKRLLNIANDRAIANGALELAPKDGADDAAVRAVLDVAAAAARRVSDEGAGATLTPEEQGALELFVLLVSRPALFVRGGRIDERPENWPELRRDSEVLPANIACVGRIDSAKGARRGTGFSVGPRKILTNNHVLSALFGKAPGWWKKDPAAFARRCDEAESAWSDAAASPRFERLGEAGSSASLSTRVLRVLGHHAAVDMALVEVETEPDGALPMLVADSEPAGFGGLRLYAIGYPVADQQNLLGLNLTPTPIFKRVFGADDATLGTKRLSPGVASGWEGADTFLHDASTLPGSSGSCLVDFASRRVVGLHFGGSYREKTNRAVALWRFKDDPMLTRNGLTFGAR